MAPRLGARCCGAELGAKIYGAELAATLAPRSLALVDWTLGLGAKGNGAKLCHLDTIRTCGAEIQSPEMQNIFFKDQNMYIFDEK